MQDLLVMGSANDSSIETDAILALAPAVQSTATSLMPYHRQNGFLTDWLEMYDYAGGARFRGFVAEGPEDKSMFVFFDEGVQGNDLKPG